LLLVNLNKQNKTAPLSFVLYFVEIYLSVLCILTKENNVLVKFNSGVREWNWIPKH